jgi:tight adherence protein B
VSASPLIMKWAAVALLAAAAFLSGSTIIGDPDSLAHRYLSRYVAYLERKLRNMFITRSGRRIVAGQAVCVAGILALRFSLDAPMLFLAVPVALFGPALYIEHLRKKRLRAIEAGMDGFILALANALKSTPSIGSALSYTLTLLHGPLEEEVALTLKEMRVGTGLDQALLNMAGRVQSMQLDATFSSLLIGRKVGGDLGKILETTAETLREMARLQGVVRSKTAEGKAQLGLLVTLPVVVLFLFDLVSDGYFAPLTQSVTGFMVIGASFSLWAASLVLARNVLSVDL